MTLAALGLAMAACAGESPGTPVPASATPVPGTPAPGPTATTRPTPAPATRPPTSSTPGEVGSRAPQFQGIVNWINSEPLSIDELKGQVVLIDFWTYTCVNCIRTMPALRSWQAKYADKGLVIVGVHTPEFEFEKVTDNVLKAANDFALVYPIAQDNDYATWTSYNNRFWPAKYLIDKDGVIRFRHFGEGAYEQTEREIRNLLLEAGANLESTPASSTPTPAVHSQAFDNDPRYRLTREIYGGYNRNNSLSGIYVANRNYYDGPNRIVNYQDPGDHVNQFIYLHGLWKNEDEALKHARVTTNYEDYLALTFFASSVNAVIQPQGEEPFEVRVLLDGLPLRESEAGPDVRIEDGRSYILVDEPRLYEIVALPEFDNRSLQLSSNSDAFSLFALTFGAYEAGP